MNLSLSSVSVVVGCCCSLFVCLFFCVRRTGGDDDLQFNNTLNERRVLRLVVIELKVSKK